MVYARFASLSVNCFVPLPKQVSIDLANCLGGPAAAAGSSRVAPGQSRQHCHDPPEQPSAPGWGNGWSILAFLILSLQLLFIAGYKEGGEYHSPAFPVSLFSPQDASE